VGGAQDIIDGIRRAIRKGTGVTFTHDQLVEMARLGILHNLAQLEADEICRSIGVAPPGTEPRAVRAEPATPDEPRQGEPPPNYSPRTLAERWSCSDGLIRKLIKEGRLAAFRHGNLIRISAAEVARYETEGPLST